MSEGPSAKDVLDRMVEVYRAAETYADQGSVRVQGNGDGGRVDTEANYLTAFERPNKIRLQAYHGTLVGDGQHLWAFSTFLPGQVLRKPCPSQVSVDSLFCDAILAGAMAEAWTQVYSLLPAQAVLLLADDPLKTLLRECRETRRIESAAIENDTCYRIEAARPDGRAVFWIDEDSYVLRRLEFPTVEVNKAVFGGRLRDLSITADFRSAQLGQSIDPTAFAFASEQAELVDRLLPPDLFLLGKPSPEFRFVGLDGADVTPASLSGKASVIEFWATTCVPCRDSLPVLDKVHRALGGGDRLNVAAVSVDPPDVNEDRLRSTFSELDVKLPVARDRDEMAGKAFHVTSIPAMVILDAEGKVQSLETGFSPNYESALSAKLRALLNGEDIYPEQAAQKLGDFEAYARRTLEWLGEKAEQDSFWGPLAVSPVPSAEIAEPTDPQTLKLSPLWKCQELQMPGNILVVPNSDGSDRILVLENETSVAELGLDGSISATYQLPLQPGESARFLRTIEDNARARWFAASASTGPRVHLFDSRFVPVLAFPPEADMFTHAGISDVQLADLENDGTPEICVSYWGDVGVQGVSFEGTRVWRSRQLANVLRLAVLGLDNNGRRNVLCVNQLGRSLALIGADGGKIAEFQVPGPPITLIVSADLDDDGQMELCGLATSETGNHTAVGLDLHGDLRWNHPLPAGMYEYAVEPVVAARLRPDPPGHWLLAGADGSIHLVSAAGQLVDRFNYGAALAGLATARVDGKQVLLVATEKGVDAWQVEMP